MQSDPEKEQKEALEASQGPEREQREAKISPEKREGFEKQEIRGEREEDVRARVEREAEKIHLTPRAAKDVKKQAGAVSAASDPGKIQRLLKLAEDKGVFFAVKVAKETGDSYVLDLLHDALAKDNLYKKYFEDKL